MALNTELRQKIGVTSTPFSQADSLLYVRSHFDIVDGTIPTHDHTTSEITGGANKVVYIDSSGDMQEVSLGIANHVLTSNGVSAVPSFSALPTHDHIFSAETVASGDHLLIGDNTDSDKAKKSNITFGTSTTSYLRNDGSWATPPTGGATDVGVGIREFTFDSSTTAADPGAGEIRFNNTSVGSVTALYINDADADAKGVKQQILGLQSGGFIKVYGSDSTVFDDNEYMVFQVTSIYSSTGYYQVFGSVTYSTTDAFENGDETWVEFIPSVRTLRLLGSRQSNGDIFISPTRGNEAVLVIVPKTYSVIYPTVVTQFTEIYTTSTYALSLFSGSSLVAKAYRDSAHTKLTITNISAYSTVEVYELL